MHDVRVKHETNKSCKALGGGVIILLSDDHEMHRDRNEP